MIHSLVLPNFSRESICVLRVMTQFAVEACASLVKEDDVPGGKVANATPRITKAE